MLNLEKARSEAEKMQFKISAGEAWDLRGADEMLKIENIRKLEALSIGPAQKAGIILVMLGMKPAAELDLKRRNDPKEKILSALDEIGLLYKEKEFGSQKNLTARIAVSYDEKILDELANCHADKDHVRFGQLMGYPESAIRAFMDKKESLDDKDYPDMAGIIFGMKLSKANWREETACLRRWSEAIAQYAPGLYQELKGRD
jgi:hypothetical protein